MLRLYLTGLEINICQCVKFRQDNVDIVCSDTGGQHRDALPVIFSCDGNKLSGLVPELLLLEEFTDHIHTAGVAYKNHLVGKFFRFQMNVKH